MPYLPCVIFLGPYVNYLSSYDSFRFPANWPVYPPALKLANWFEFYTDALELNIWTSSNITSVRQDPATNKWNVEVKRGDGTERNFTVSHVIFCTGLGNGVPNTPKYPGMVSVIFDSLALPLLHTKYRTISMAKYCTPPNISVQPTTLVKRWLSWGPAVQVRGHCFPHLRRVLT
jgi:hypothetical protein